MELSSVLVLYNKGDYSEHIARACYSYVCYLSMCGFSLNVDFKLYKELEGLDVGEYHVVYCTEYYTGRGVVINRHDDLSVFKRLLFKDLSMDPFSLYEYRDFRYREIVCDLDTYLVLCTGESADLYTQEELKDKIMEDLGTLIRVGEYEDSEKENIDVLYRDLSRDGMVDGDLREIVDYFNSCYALYKEYLGVKESLTGKSRG